MKFLLGLGDLVIGWRLLVQARSRTRPWPPVVSAADEAFYQGKGRHGDVLCPERLPYLTVTRTIVETIDDDVMSAARSRVLIARCAHLLEAGTPAFDTHWAG